MRKNSKQKLIIKQNGKSSFKKPFQMFKFKYKYFLLLF